MIRIPLTDLVAHIVAATTQLNGQVPAETLAREVQSDTKEFLGRYDGRAQEALIRKIRQELGNPAYKATTLATNVNALLDIIEVIEEPRP